MKRSVSLECSICGDRFGTAEQKDTHQRKASCRMLHQDSQWDQFMDSMEVPIQYSSLREEKAFSDAVPYAPPPIRSGRKKRKDGTKEGGSATLSSPVRPKHAVEEAPCPNGKHNIPIETLSHPRGRCFKTTSRAGSISIRKQQPISFLQATETHKRQKGGGKAHGGGVGTPPSSMQNQPPRPPRSPRLPPNARNMGGTIFDHPIFRKTEERPRQVLMAEKKFLAEGLLRLRDTSAPTTRQQSHDTDADAPSSGRKSQRRDQKKK